MATRSPGPITSGLGGGYYCYPPLPSLPSLPSLHPARPPTTRPPPAAAATSTHSASLLFPCYISGRGGGRGAWAGVLGGGGPWA
ncbi:hypothetical protein E2C01_046849 [Portunus trituberculatus]|uniref:Uncharacterized protein n=1 Tax=Portunus trituberculatus TaxID=210409 RepID=A0A5B7G5U5_PORTR|nr:hypothetical protein [Portunus trituberculatus]